MKRSLRTFLASPPVLIAAGAAVALLIAGCAVSPPTIPPVKQVDLQRFMGDWYVIGNIPTRPERNAFNAVESYTLWDMIPEINADHLALLDRQGASGWKGRIHL